MGNTVSWRIACRVVSHSSICLWETKDGGCLGNFFPWETPVNLAVPMVRTKLGKKEREEILKEGWVVRPKNCARKNKKLMVNEVRKIQTECSQNRCHKSNSFLTFSIASILIVRNSLSSSPNSWER